MTSPSHTVSAWLRLLHLLCAASALSQRLTHLHHHIHFYGYPGGVSRVTHHLLKVRQGWQLTLSRPGISPTHRILSLQLNGKLSLHQVNFFLTEMGITFPKSQTSLTEPCLWLAQSHTFLLSHEKTVSAFHCLPRAECRVMLPWQLWQNLGHRGYLGLAASLTKSCCVTLAVPQLTVCLSVTGGDNWACHCPSADKCPSPLALGFTNKSPVRK